MQHCCASCLTAVFQLIPYYSVVVLIMSRNVCFSRVPGKRTVAFFIDVTESHIKQYHFPFYFPVKLWQLPTGQGSVIIILRHVLDGRSEFEELQLLTTPSVVLPNQGTSRFLVLFEKPRHVVEDAICGSQLRRSAATAFSRMANCTVTSS